MSNSQQHLSTEARQAITVLRALTVSRKYPASLRELMKEYRSLEGRNINYQRFGFRTLDDLINASGEFIVNRTQNETYLSAKPSKNSAHISAMVKRQKASRRKSTTLQFRMPVSSDLSWNKSSYSSHVFRNLPTSPIKGRTTLSNTTSSYTRKPGDNNNNKTQDNRNTQYNSKEKTPPPAPQQIKPQFQQQQQQSSHKVNIQRTVKQQQPEQDLREILNAKLQSNAKSNLTLNIVKVAANDNSLQDRIDRSPAVQRSFSPITVQCNQTIETHSINKTNINQILPSRNTNLNVKLQRIANTAKKYGQSPVLALSLSTNESFPLPVKEPLSPVVIQPISPVSPSKMSIQERLKIRPATLSIGNDGTNQGRDSPSIISYSSVIDMEHNKTKQDESKQLVTPTPLDFEFNASLDPITALAQYCTFRNYLQPLYKTLKVKFSGNYQCRVHVNGIIYSTYPSDYHAEALAQVACAAMAIQEIKSLEMKKRYPICIDSDVELAMKIHQELKNHQHGIFCKNIPEMFEKTFEQTLPDHWISIIQSSNQFILESTAGDNLIVYPNLKTDSSSAGSSTSESEFIVLDKITLPWENKYWNLYITYCVSTVEIWARIVGKEYSDQLDSIMNDIDVYMLTEKSRPNSITLGQIYLVCISECWHRIRVEEMDKTAGTCLCFFIDFGDEESLPMEQLFICEPRFLKLSPQAIPFSLFGLEDFAENPNAKRHLDAMLIGKSLVGEILSKKDAIESTNNSNGDDFNVKIQVVLYDTSSSEDVNLNPLLLNQICDDTPPPELKKNGVTNVNITEITSSGEIYLQVRNPGLLYVQKLVHQLVESKFKEDNHRVDENDMKKSNLYLVQDSDNRWYRGTLADSESKINASTYNIFYVDYGITKPINISRIFRLDSLSAALSKFPRQAMKVKLHNIPPINKAIIARIKGLLPKECPAIVKIACNAVVPHVIVYRRFDANQGLFNVNEVIQIEYELETNTSSETSENDMIFNNSVANVRRKSDSPVPNQSVMSEMTAIVKGLSLRSSITVPSSPQKGDLPKLTSNVFIPEVGEYFDVLVTMASNPNNFIVQPYCDGPKLVEMMTELQAHCSNNDEFIPIDMLEVGQAYAALHTDGNYHRVIVENIFEVSMIHVNYCDFGDIAVISPDKLKTLPARFRNLPKQAIAAKLHGIKPKHVDWTLDDCMRFKELTVGQKFVSEIKNITSDAVSPNDRIIELQLIDVSTADDIFIHKLLIKEDRAVPCD